MVTVPGSSACWKNSVAKSGSAMPPRFAGVPAGAALELGERARQEIIGHELGYYLSTLEQVRTTTLAELGRREDQWLEEQTSFGSGQRVNNYFKWFHVFGHELNHRGQIRWLRSRATRRL